MIVIYPTETCYGLGCSISDVDSIHRVRKLKRRDGGKCLPVVVHDIMQWKEVAVPNEAALTLAKAFWPGPLTLVTEKREGVPDELCPDSIASRFSPHEVVLALTAELGPLVATSANFSGGPNPRSLDEVPTPIREAADWIIDGGELSGKPSTVYNCLTQQVVREGPVSSGEISEKIKKK
jgi:L-threonylcarbamoyladenylate synthase